MSASEPTVEEVQARVSRIGSILGWLQSIEFMLRWWLTKAAGLDIVLPTHVGQVMDKTPFTDYRSLGALLAAYNAQLSAAESKYHCDERIVQIRDAHAHGRCVGIADEEHLTLYRFSEPENGKVRVISMKALSPDELEAEMDLMRAQWDRINECGASRGYFH